MRRPVFILPAVAALLAAACNDGPNDAYQPAPADAGWNSGNGNPANADAGQGYDSGYPTSSKTVLCDTTYRNRSLRLRCTLR